MLICAMIVTLFWGGRAGARPAFLVTALVRDQQQGRGVGKTSVVELIASLAGGLMMFSGHDKKADVDNRLLSSGGTGYRLLLLDNLKTHRLSIADLEAQITAPVISGHRLFMGEGQRPNTVTWALTMNGGSPNKDLAQRCMIIRVARPQYGDAWDDRVCAYIEAHRMEILGDIRGLLEPAVEEHEESSPQYSRWSSWEREVLSRVANLAEVQKTMAQRRGELDDDEETKGIVPNAMKLSACRVSVGV